MIRIWSSRDSPAGIVTSYSMLDPKGLQTEYDEGHVEEDFYEFTSD